MILGENSHLTGQRLAAGKATQSLTKRPWVFLGDGKQLRVKFGLSGSWYDK